jgi:proteasome lid subunit RPN8/RPN11
VSDSLRAQHHESTKGSFKFTHETWAQITRDRDEFPPELQMVGWYHTHPGWGIFLSVMDLFICDHFFNRPLDVALVIDPCQGDRGFFQWTGVNGAPPERTGGFYLTASRFRELELRDFATRLEGKTTMATDPRHSVSAGSYPAPIVHVASPQAPWQILAVLGMLSL